MRNRTGNHGRLASRSIAAGLVLLLVLTGLPGWQTGWPPAAEAQMTKSDWSKVQTVKPGTPTKVVLYKDQAPRGSRKIKGRFQSATEDSLTLKIEYGPTRTLPKSAVRKVLVHRPLKKRYQVWVAVGIGTLLWALLALPASHDFSVTGKAMIAGIIAVPTGMTVLFAPKMGGIYNLPRKHRAQPPADKPPSAEGKASGNASP